MKKQVWAETGSSKNRLQRTNTQKSISRKQTGDCCCRLSTTVHIGTILCILTLEVFQFNLILCFGSYVRGHYRNYILNDFHIGSDSQTWWSVLVSANKSKLSLLPEPGGPQETRLWQCYMHMYKHTHCTQTWLTIFLFTCVRVYSKLHLATQLTTRQQKQSGEFELQYSDNVIFHAKRKL